MSQPDVDALSVGVLALQGDFAAHAKVLDAMGVRWREVRTPDGLAHVCGLILPGGESTTMLKLLTEEGFIEPLHMLLERGGAFFGTCAGAILLAKQVEHPAQPSLGFVDIVVERNAYGRQVNSFIDWTMSSALGPPPLELVFIRAPIIRHVGAGVEVLAEHQGHPVLVRQGRCLVATFHPELTEDRRVHQLFLQMLSA
ncbi:MAG: pyridoxal 5'-phosphate synthase glutaminase subunit PdxT [Acidobacteriota bacterium]|nr:pyridoxal 5'-phosphate synthase glutaminase subunit PdxT [Blastocatellia bacterium]MDW8239423.1 pyridoxal 5'-phosphate synthase glutaminase subunit PdxT [Acidobacteriota bacterium]